MNPILQINQADLEEIIRKFIEPLLSRSERALIASQGERYLTPDETMKMLSISRPTLWRMVHKYKKLTEYKVAGQSRYKLSEIRAMVDKDRVIC